MPKPTEVDDLTIIESSGNVYADLDLPDAADLLLKAELSIKIGQLIKAKKLSQESAAGITGMTQPKLSGVLRGKTDGVSINKLVNAINGLGQAVSFHVDYTKLRAKARPVRVTG